MDFFIDKLLCCFGIKEFEIDKKSQEEIFNKISLAMDNKLKEINKSNISIENLNLGQSDPTEILETPEIVNKTPDIEFYEYLNNEDNYSSLVLTNSDEYENFSKVICGFFYTVSFIIMINVFVIQRKFLIYNYFKNDFQMVPTAAWY